MSLHNKIMNIPCEMPDLTGIDPKLAYRLGHRDARHAASVLSEKVMNHATAKVKPLRWSRWGNEWDANSILGTFTVKMDIDSGFYLYQGDNKVTNFIRKDQDRSTPDHCMDQAFLIVQTAVLEALK